jgi:hypothetical protein
MTKKPKPAAIAADTGKCAYCVIRDFVDGLLKIGAERDSLAYALEVTARSVRAGMVR